MNLADDQPLEIALRDNGWERDHRLAGGCWFGTNNHSNNDAACRRNPHPDSRLGLCPEHLKLIRAWADGHDLPDPRPPMWQGLREGHGMFPDIYVGGIPIGSEAA